MNIEELNMYALLKTNIENNVERIVEENIHQCNNKEDIDSLIRWCGWIQKDALQMLKLLNKVEK